jgi:phosphoglycolate phosphatase-like HAD superfamily hydrolase
LLNIELGEDDLAALALRFSELVEEAVVAAPWVPGAQDMMIRNQGRRPMFVVSGTPDEELRRIVDRRQMGGFFTSVWGSPPEKPPIILELLARHRLAADRSIFIGDAMTDYLAAEATGLGFIGRVPEGEASPFPEGTAVIPDLSCFAEAGL